MDDAANAVLQMDDVKVDQEADREPGKLEIRQHLGSVDRFECSYGFEFDDDCMLHDQVQAVAAVQVDAAVLDSHWNLTLNFQAGASQFVEQTRVVGGFQ